MTSGLPLSWSTPCHRRRERRRRGPTAETEEHFQAAKRRRAIQLLGRVGVVVPPPTAATAPETPSGQQVLQQVEQEMRCAAVGTPAEVRDYLDRFTAAARVDELIVASVAVDHGDWLSSVEVLAEVSGLAVPWHGAGPGRPWPASMNVQLSPVSRASTVMAA
ncbi:hypothetical protein AB0O67_05195 [Streptomyces sp. NPDC086077]|uniref:hypothetical protein n=1 Tax=Streptomyces sp. NPDC086077 TaxID=3154862 RepID=UPI00342D8098